MFCGVVDRQMVWEIGQFQFFKFRRNNDVQNCMVCFILVFGCYVGEFYVYFCC